MFINPEIVGDQIYDMYCNKLLNIAYSILNDIIVSSDILALYVEKIYLDFTMILSTAKCLKSIKEFNVVALDYSLNHSAQLSFFTLKKEIFINAYYKEDCSNCFRLFM